MTDLEKVVAIQMEALVVINSCKKIAAIMYDNAALTAEEAALQTEAQDVEQGLYGMALACPLIKAAIINNYVDL